MSRPQVPFVNVVHGSQCGVVFLENPVGHNKIATVSHLCQEISLLFGTDIKDLFTDSRCSASVLNMSDLNGSTVFTSSSKENRKTGTEKPEKGQACCPWVNVDLAENKGTVGPNFLKILVFIMLKFQFLQILSHEKIFLMTFKFQN